MKSPQPDDSEIKQLIEQFAREGERAGSLVKIVAQGLQCPASFVRRYVQSHYPGLLVAQRAVRELPPESLKGGKQTRMVFNTSHLDVYKLPARKRQGGYRF